MFGQGSSQRSIVALDHSWLCPDFRQAQGVPPDFGDWDSAYDLLRNIGFRERLDLGTMPAPFPVQVTCAELTKSLNLGLVVGMRTKEWKRQGLMESGAASGQLSLISQTNSANFSYCLTFDSSKTLIICLHSTISPLKQSLSETHYSTSLEAIKRNGRGGLVIDLGTTYTHFHNPAFELVIKDFKSQTNLSVAGEYQTNSSGLDLCFNMPSDAIIGNVVPKLIFHFKGADMELPWENYMIDAGARSGLVCLLCTSLKILVPFNS
ncbi:hypothetical protein Sjap_013688 [Stephania japonica]|uniref:Xylanase inhibitor C-terminal domain-containing protein n=1 Tax=Stephania japonica TaxID=461633 RepID=A0AAP0IYD2_9MAGN